MTDQELERARRLARRVLDCVAGSQLRIKERNAVRIVAGAIRDAEARGRSAGELDRALEAVVRGTVKMLVGHVVAEGLRLGSADLFLELLEWRTGRRWRRDDGSVARFLPGSVEAGSPVVVEVAPAGDELVDTVERRVGVAQGKSA